MTTPTTLAMAGLSIHDPLSLDQFGDAVRTLPQDALRLKYLEVRNEIANLDHTNEQLLVSARGGLHNGGISLPDPPDPVFERALRDNLDAITHHVHQRSILRGEALRRGLRWVSLEAQWEQVMEDAAALRREVMRRLPTALCPGAADSSAAFLSLVTGNDVDEARIQAGLITEGITMVTNGRTGQSRPLLSAGPAVPGPGGGSRRITVTVVNAIAVENGLETPTVFAMEGGTVPYRANHLPMTYNLYMPNGVHMPNGVSANGAPVSNGVPTTNGAPVPNEMDTSNAAMGTHAPNGTPAPPPADNQLTNGTSLANGATNGEQHRDPSNSDDKGQEQQQVVNELQVASNAPMVQGMFPESPQTASVLFSAHPAQNLELHGMFPTRPRTVSVMCPASPPTVDDHPANPPTANATHPETTRTVVRTCWYPSGNRIVNAMWPPFRQPPILNALCPAHPRSIDVTHPVSQWSVVDDSDSEDSSTGSAAHPESPESLAAVDDNHPASPPALDETRLGDDDDDPDEDGGHP